MKGLRARGAGGRHLNPYHVRTYVKAYAIRIIAVVPRNITAAGITIISIKKATILHSMSSTLEKCQVWSVHRGQSGITPIRGDFSSPLLVAHWLCPPMLVVMSARASLTCHVLAGVSRVELELV